jgi:DUF4097 and DUF4098 domain-containing protein YvlB
VKEPRSENAPAADQPENGFGGFLRGLLSGIPWSECAESEEVLGFAGVSGNVIKLHNGNGRTRVVGEDREDIEIRARKTARAESAEAAQRLLSQIRIVGEEVNGCLELEVLTPRKWNRRGHAALDVSVPRSARIEVSAPNGKVYIEGVQGGATVRSSNGAACIRDVLGDIVINTSNARVQCSCCCGHLIARSSNGKIELDRHRGSLDATTSNGLILATVEEVGELGVHLATSNGRIVLGLPEDVHAELDLWVDNGIIRNDRQLESASRETRGRVLGRIGGGGALIKLRTSNGSISVR